MSDTPTPAASGGTRNDSTGGCPKCAGLAACWCDMPKSEPPASAPGSGEIQRWRQHYKAPLRFGDSQEFGLKPDAAGPWVRYDDHFAALARARSEVVTSLMDQLGVMSVQDDPRTMSGNPTDWMAAGLDAIKQTARAEGEAMGRREADADAERFRWLCDEQGLGFTYDAKGYGMSSGKWGDWPSDLREGVDAAMVYWRKRNAAAPAWWKEGK